jgi:hypothetical protein
MRHLSCRKLTITKKTTEGSILSSTRHGADLDFHIIVPREHVWCSDKELGEIVLQKLLPRFADVVDMSHVAKLCSG